MRKDIALEHVIGLFLKNKNAAPDTATHIFLKIAVFLLLYSDSYPEYAGGQRSGECRRQKREAFCQRRVAPNAAPQAGDPKHPQPQRKFKLEIRHLAAAARRPGAGICRHGGGPGIPGPRTRLSPAFQPQADDHGPGEADPGRRRHPLPRTAAAGLLRNHSRRPGPGKTGAIGRILRPEHRFSGRVAAGGRGGKKKPSATWRRHRAENR